MKLHLTTAENEHLITGYGDDFIAVNTRKYPQNILLTPNEIYLDWFAGTFESLSTEPFGQLITLNPEVVLLGTGESHQFLHPKHYANLTDANIPLECMTTAAACRTYNILMSEGRHVALASLLTT